MKSTVAAVYCVLALFGTAESYAASDSGAEQGLSSPAASWYRNAFLDIPQTSRGRTASLNVGEVEQGPSSSVRIDELFRLYENADFDGALEKITELNSQLRADEAANKQNLAITLDFKGVILQRKGDLQLAVQAHSEALGFLEALGYENTDQGVAVRNNLSVAQYLLGNYEVSASVLTSIIAIPTLKPIARARARNNRGLIYADIGQADKAMIDFSYAESAARSADAPQLLAQILNNEASAWAKQKNQTKAQGAFAEGLQLADKTHDRALQADILDSWAELLIDSGDFQPALDKLRAASEAEAQANAPLVRVSILKNRGRALAGLNQSEEALHAYTEAYESADTMELASQKRDILSYRGALLAKLGKIDPAIEDYALAINIAEKTRERLGEESETGFIQSTANLYKETVELLLKRNNEGDAEKAFAMLERSQSAALQEQMAASTPVLRDKQAMRDISGARGVLRQEAAIAKKLQIALTAADPDKKNIDALRKQLADARREAVRALGELSDKYNGRYDHFVPAAVDPKYLRDIAQFLPARSLLVTYSFGDDGLYIFLASRDGKIEFRQNLNVSKAELEKKIAEYRGFVTHLPGRSRDDLRIDSWSDPKWLPLRDVTAWLYQQLLAPIADRIQSADQVIFAPTGQMYYLPFHALGLVDASGRQMQYLALSKKVSYVAPGSLLKAFDARSGAASRDNKKPRILALGDVQFGPSSNLDQLPSSRDELKAVKDIFGTDAVLLEGQKATKRGLLDALNHSPASGPSKAADSGNRFSFVLLSTHGILNAREPHASYLALENDNRLTAPEISSLDLRGISVVSLSACETGLAGRNPGAELMSLGEYVSLAGASAVLASLWKVDDLQTSNLMREFYTRLRKDANNKSAALQHAQIALATHPESTHPFFWSPFVLYGRGW